MGWIGPKSVMPKMWNLDFDQPIRRCHPIQFLHHLLESVKIRSHMFEHMFHQNEVKCVVFKWPWRLFEIHQDIRAALWELIRVDPPIPAIKAASKI